MLINFFFKMKFEIHLKFSILILNKHKIKGNNGKNIRT